MGRFLRNASLLGLASLALLLSFCFADEECARVSTWTGGNSEDFNDAANWAKPPKDISITVLNNADSETVVNNLTRVSAVKVSNNHLLKVSGAGGYLKVTNTEVHCFNVNWCSGHGICTGVDTCECAGPWTGPACSVRKEGSCFFNGENVNPNECGRCPEDPLGSSPTCQCGQVLDRPNEEINKLLLIDTNAKMMDAIETTKHTLMMLKHKAKYEYDASTRELEAKLPDWIEKLQNFCLGNFEKIFVKNLRFLDKINKLTPLPDPCAASAHEEDLRKQLEMY